MENKNLEQNSKNNNLRDYDKEPIVIKDYHQIFNSVLSWFSAFIAFTILLNLYIFIYSYLLNATDDKLIKEVGNYIITINAIVIFISLFYFIVSYYIFIIRRKQKFILQINLYNFMNSESYSTTHQIQI